jgi:hypothetical protein
MDPKSHTMYSLTTNDDGDKVVTMVQVPTLALLNVEELQALFARSRKAEGRARSKALKIVRLAGKVSR